MGTNREFQGIYADGDSAPRKETGTPKAALRSKVLDPCTPKRNGDAEGGFAKQSA